MMEDLSKNYRYKKNDLSPTPNQNAQFLLVQCALLVCHRSPDGNISETNPGRCFLLLLQRTSIQLEVRTRRAPRLLVMTYMSHCHHHSGSGPSVDWHGGLISTGVSWITRKVIFWPPQKFSSSSSSWERGLVLLLVFFSSGRVRKQKT